MIKGSFDGINTRVLRYITEYYEKELNYKLPNYYPIIGKNFNVTRAGIHADGLLKNLEMYLPFDTEELLDIPPRVMVSEHSGLAGIAFWINSFFRLKGDEKISKDDPALKFIQDEVIKQYHEGRVTAMLDEEVVTLVKRYLPNIWEKYKDRVTDSSVLGS
jgi:isopropylmalate/homocitrate/citramalate synthase